MTCKNCKAHLTQQDQTYFYSKNGVVLERY